MYCHLSCRLLLVYVLFLLIWVIKLGHVYLPNYLRPVSPALTLRTQKPIKAPKRRCSENSQVLPITSNVARAVWHRLLKPPAGQTLSREPVGLGLALSISARPPPAGRLPGLREGPRCLPASRAPFMTLLLSLTHPQSPAFARFSEIPTTTLLTDGHLTFRGRVSTF